MCQSLTKIQFKIVRHGKTDWNLSKRLQGHLDIPINEIGREQGEAVGSYLREYAVDHIYSSDLTRCRQTAQYIRSYHSSAKYHEAQEFREGHAGIFGGKALGDFMKSEIQSLGALKQFFTHYGETMEDVFSRVWGKMEQIISIFEQRQDQSSFNVVIVSHGGPIRMILARLLGFSPDRLNEAASEIKVNNCSISTITYSDGRWELEEINFVDHLPKKPVGLA